MNVLTVMMMLSLSCVQGRGNSYLEANLDDLLDTLDQTGNALYLLHKKYLAYTYGDSSFESRSVAPQVEVQLDEAVTKKNSATWQSSQTKCGPGIGDSNSYVNSYNDQLTNKILQCPKNMYLINLNHTENGSLKGYCCKPKKIRS